MPHYNNRAAATIAQELREIGTHPMAALNIANETVEYLISDSAAQHNGPGAQSPYITAFPRPDQPPADMPEHLKATVVTIMVTLTQAIRDAGGPACPDIDLPMRYAAHAALLAAKHPA